MPVTGNTHAQGRMCSVVLRPPVLGTEATVVLTPVKHYIAARID